MKIGLIGDIHRNEAWIKVVMDRCKAENADAAVFLGDWGYTLDLEWRKLTSALVEKLGIPIYWIDGNHDNHEYIREHLSSPDEFNEFWPGVFYIPRGHVWTWEGVTFMGVGGAYSIDWERRTLGSAEAVPTVSWLWQPEELTVAEFHNITAKDEKVQVMLTHDAPHGVPTIENHALPIPRSVPHRQALAALVRKFKPWMIFHGHWHYPYRDFLEVGLRQVHVTGLSADPAMMGFVDPANMLFITVKDGDVTDHGFAKDAPVELG